MIDPAKLQDTEDAINAFFDQYNRRPFSPVGQAGATAINKLLSLIEDYKDEITQAARENTKN